MHLMLPTSFVAVNKFQIIWRKVAFKKPSKRERKLISSVMSEWVLSSDMLLDQLVL